jgi:hypothetical protein
MPISPCHCSDSCNSRARDTILVSQMQLHQVN